MVTRSAVMGCPVTVRVGFTCSTRNMFSVWETASGELPAEMICTEDAVLAAAFSCRVVFPVNSSEAAETAVMLVWMFQGRSNVPAPTLLKLGVVQVESTLLVAPVQFAVSQSSSSNVRADAPEVLFTWLVP